MTTAETSDASRRLTRKDGGSWLVVAPACATGWRWHARLAIVDRCLLAQLFTRADRRAGEAGSRREGAN